MSGITTPQQQALDKALAAIKTLGGQRCESKEVPLGQFLKLLTEYQRNKTAFQAQEARKNRVIRGVGTAAERQREATKIADPSLTIVGEIKKLDAKALRGQLQGKFMPEEDRGLDQLVSPAEKASSAWNDLLVLVDCVSPELRPVVATAPMVMPPEGNKRSASGSFLEGDAKLAAQLQQEENQRIVLEGEGKHVPPPRPQVQEQLIDDDFRGGDPIGGAGSIVQWLIGTQARLASVQQETQEVKQCLAELKVQLESFVDPIQPQRRQQLVRPIPDGHPWWYWLALFLFTALVLACTTALVLGVISLASHAAFWIVPAAAAGTVTLISAFVLLLLLVGGLQYMSSSTKTLGGGSSQPLLPAGVRSDAAPAAHPATAALRPVHGSVPYQPSTAPTLGPS